MKEHIGIKSIGSVKYFQRDNRTGLMIPGTYVENENTIYPDLRYYLAYKIGTDTTNQSLSNRFATGGTLSSGDNGYDGIAYSTIPIESLSHKLDTDINAGGNNSTNYIEFSGSIAGELNMSGYLVLGHSYLHSSTIFVDTYAYYSITQFIESGRTFYFYWRITLI